MPANLIDGKEHAARLRVGIVKEVERLKKLHDLKPGLAVLLVGNDPASEVYVRNKGIHTKEAGMESLEFRLPAETPEKELLAKIDDLNKDSNVNGILVQLPIPSHMSQQRVIETILPEKDVDGLHPINAGYLVSGLDGFVPCTPKGATMLIKNSIKDLAGKNAVIIGRSNLVGKPIAQLLLKENCTVTICHSRTDNLQKVCLSADILVAAVGRPEMVKADWVKPGSVVIDVGVNRIPAPEKGEGKNKLVGDVEFEKAREIADAITPVPGGVGPMTIACLLLNTLHAFCLQNGFEKPDIRV